MKHLVETTGQFMLMLPVGTLYGHRPCVVEPSQFLQEKISLGLVKLLEPEVPDAATDDEFAKFYTDHEGDWEAAIQNYMLKLDEEVQGEGETGGGDETGGEGETAPEAAPKKTRSRKPAAKPGS